MAKKEHYIDNKKFFQAMVDYRQSIEEAEETGEPKPQIPNFIGECFMKIAEHLSYKPNFINYTFREDMISDGIENCIQYIHNFDPQKSQNPFSYFTQIIYYAFLRRIQKEKKQLYVKYKSLEKAITEDELSTLQEYENSENPASSPTYDMHQNLYDFIEQFEEKNFKKKEPKTAE